MPPFLAIVICLAAIIVGGYGAYYVIRSFLPFAPPKYVDPAKRCLVRVLGALGLVVGFFTATTVNYLTAGSFFTLHGGESLGKTFGLSHFGTWVGVVTIVACGTLMATYDRSYHDDKSE